MNRRTSILSLLASAGGSAAAFAANAGDKLRIDEELIQITKNPHGYMFADQATDHVDGRGFVKIHSVAAGANRDGYVELRPGTVRYFRSDGVAASDGKRAEIAWTLGKAKYSTQVGKPGSVIMVVRSLDGIISWYSMQRDFRC